MLDKVGDAVGLVRLESAARVHEDANGRRAMMGLLCRNPQAIGQRGDLRGEKWRQRGGLGLLMDT